MQKDLEKYVGKYVIVGPNEYLCLGWQDEMYRDI